jgi:hypothetical protein
MPPEPQPRDWKRWIARGLMVAGVLAPWAGLGAQGAIAPADSRRQALAAFFRRYDSPLLDLTGDFLDAADRHGLDWRLLPGIAMVETTAGKHARYSNIFGWNSGKARFRSPLACLEFVAERLATSPLYAGKDMAAILRTYNPANARYPDRVMKYIRQLRVAPTGSVQ